VAKMGQSHRVTWEVDGHFDPWSQWPL